MYLGVLPARLSMRHMTADICRGQRTWDSLTLELQLSDIMWVLGIHPGLPLLSHLFSPRLLFCFVFERGSLSCPGTYYVDQADLRLRNLLVSASQVHVPPLPGCI